MKISSMDCIYGVKEGGTVSTFIRVGDQYGCTDIEAIGDFVHVTVKGYPVPIMIPMSNVKYMQPVKVEEKVAKK